MSTTPTARSNWCSSTRWNSIPGARPPPIPRVRNISCSTWIPAPEIAWSRVVAAAIDVRDLLAKAGLKSFVRTTGGKGLHVVVPLRPAARWDKAKKFAHALADSFAAVRPDEFLAVASKQRRDGRIFIDYLRNTRGATSVASYSLRARPGAPVAIPLRWAELKTLKSGDAFNIRNVPARLKRMRGDPWAGYDSLRQGLDGIADTAAQIAVAERLGGFA